MAGSERKGRAKSRDTEDNKKASGRKRSSSGSPSKKKKAKEPFSHIGPQLLPSAAVAPAVHASPSKILKSRSPSPVAKAIACATRIGKSIIGEVSLSSKHNYPLPNEEKIEHIVQSHTEHVSEDIDPDYEEPYDLQEYRPNGYHEEEFQELQSTEMGDPLYATVQKNRQHNRDEVRIDPGDSDDSIYDVSEMEDRRVQPKMIGTVLPEDFQLDVEDNQFSDGELGASFDRRHYDPDNSQSPEDQNRLPEATGEMGTAGSSKSIGNGLPPPATSRSTHSMDLSVNERGAGEFNKDGESDNDSDKERNVALKQIEEIGFEEITRDFGLESTPEERNFFKPSDVEKEIFAGTPMGSYPGLSTLNASNSLNHSHEVIPLHLEPVDLKEEIIHEENEPEIKSPNSSRELVLADLKRFDVAKVENEKKAIGDSSRLEYIVKQQEEMIKRLSNHLSKQDSMQSGLDKKQAELSRLLEIKTQNDLRRTEERGQDIPNVNLNKQKERTSEVIRERSVDNTSRTPSTSPDRSMGRRGFKLAVRDAVFEEEKRKRKVHEQDKEIMKTELENERKKFSVQQKVIKDQQRQLLEMQAKFRDMSQKQQRSTTSTPAHLRLGGSHRTQTNLDQNFLLESRLKQMEDERNALLQLNSSLQEENAAIKALSVVYHEAGGPDGIIIKKHNEEVTKENSELKAIVHRLNIELSRYQANYRAPTKEEVLDLTFQPDGPVPPWLIDIKYLSPLVLAYDDKLREKNELIKSVESQLLTLKTRAQEIVRENQELQLSLEGQTENGGVTHDEWVHLQEQGKLVVEENALLMSQLDLKDRRAEEVRKEHQEEVSKFMKQLRLTEGERREAENNLSDLYLKHEKLQRKFERVQTELNKRITMDKHKTVIEDLCKESQEKVDALKNEKESLNGRIEAVTNECRQLAVKLTDESASKLRLQTDLRTSNKAIRQLEKKLLSLQDKLESSHERERVAGDTLRQVLAVAEKTAVERDNCLEIIQSQHLSKDSVKRQAKESETRIKDLKTQLKEYKNQAERNEDVITQRSRDHDRQLNRIREKYESELNSFRTLTREKQRLLEQTQLDKSRLEEQLDALVQKLKVEDSIG